jgi:TonB family protein
VLWLNTDPDGRRLARAAGLTGVIYGLVCLFLFLTPYRMVVVAPCGTADLVGSSYYSVRLSLAVSASTGMPGSAGGLDGSAKAGTPAVAGKALPSDSSGEVKSPAGPADIVNAQRLADLPVRAPVRVSSFVVPVADHDVLDIPSGSNIEVAAPADVSRNVEASTSGVDSMGSGNDAISSQGDRASRSVMEGSGTGDVSPSVSGSSSGTVGGSAGNAGGYTFSGNGFLPDGVRGTGRFSSWIDGAIRKRLVYPERARRRNVQGSVILALSVPADGSRCEASVLESSGSAILDDAALSLLRSLFPAPVPPEKEFHSPVKIQYLIVQD